MSDDLDDLLRRAAKADGSTRIEFRDLIATHGTAAIARLEAWLADPRLGGFAVVTIKAAALLGAFAEARATLRRARPLASPTVAGDIDRALGSLPGSVPTRMSNVKAQLRGSPAEALDALRGLVQEWRGRGSPPQPAMEWRRADWMAAFPVHGDDFDRLPSTLDRAAVRAGAAGVDQDPTRAEFAFLVVKAWGEGDNGYGPSRALESLMVTDRPGERLMAAAQTLRARGALAAYQRMSDGGDCRIFNLGPAFGTKVLYFWQPESQRPRALIHDKNVADWLSQHAGLSLGSSVWSARRYREYLDQMHGWAEALECSPDDVELLIFRSILGPGNQWADT